MNRPAKFRRGNSALGAEVPEAWAKLYGFKESGNSVSAALKFASPDHILSFRTALEQSWGRLLPKDRNFFNSLPALWHRIETEWDSFTEDEQATVLEGLWFELPTPIVLRS